MGSWWSSKSSICSKEDEHNLTNGKVVRTYVALDPSGTPGSFFNERRDAILGKLSINQQSTIRIITERTICELFNDRTIQTKNLLDLVDIDDLLQLGLLCKIVVPTGVASIIDYPHPIDGNTRFLQFKLSSFCESLDVDLLDKDESWKTLIPKESTSHMITEVHWGIHVIIVLRLPTEHLDQIESVLKKIKGRLCNETIEQIMAHDENRLCEKITSIKVYSNIPDLTEMNKLLVVCERIVQIRDNHSEHRRMSYILTSLPTSNPQHHDNTDDDHLQIDFGQINQTIRNLYKQLSRINALRFLFEEELPKLTQNKLEESIDKFRRDFAKLIELYKNDAQKTYQLVHDIRNGQLLINSLDQFSNSEAQLLIEKNMQNLELFLNALIEKERFIQQLQNKGHQYCNVAKCGIDQDCDEQLISDILFKGKQKKIFICSTDQLNQESSISWDQIRSRLRRERRKNRHVLPVYADFTYSTWRLDKMIILPSKEQPISSAPSPVFENIPSQSVSTDSCINILLLGESGVGKSTFINAFANYLHFHSLEAAKTGQPIVVIPVSFLMSTGQDFEQHSINFGHVDPNENHNNIGQSVTQQCRSYVFEIAPGKKLRIIDTPGFADTRGDGQDQINMDAVFSFINNLTHLNAVFLLLKPNVARLNPFLYTYFTRIFEWFGEGIRDHLIFCFTNARSTFFAPGDTGPLLRSFLKTFPIKHIPFEKRNTFCFDSESFRYLVALQNNLKLNELEEDEFVKSWTRSVDESRRLQTSLCNVFHPYRRNVEWQSMKDLHHQINSMIRPMLEGIRNILRNLILCDRKCSIRLKATAVNCPSMICYKCERTPKQFDSFWIYPDLVHHSPNECSSNELIPTEYTLDYEYLVQCTENSQDTLGEQETFLYDAYVQFAHFLLVTKARDDDPFLSGLMRMVEEETNICEQYRETNHNRDLVNLLNASLEEYGKLFEQTHLNKDDELLSTMYELIQSLNEIPMINEQMYAIRKYQQLALKSNERDISTQTNSF